MQTVITAVKTTRAIDRKNTAQIIEFQDILSKVTAEEAQAIVKSLTRNERGILFWIACSVLSYDGFLWWLKESLVWPLINQEKLAYHREIMNELGETISRAQAEQLRIQEERAALADARENLQERERKISQQVKLTQMRAGEEVRLLRHQVARLEREVATERNKNRLVKLALRLA